MRKHRREENFDIFRGDPRGGGRELKKPQLPRRVYISFLRALEEIDWQVAWSLGSPTRAEKAIFLGGTYGRTQRTRSGRGERPVRYTVFGKHRGEMSLSTVSYFNRAAANSPTERLFFTHVCLIPPGRRCVLLPPTPPPPCRRVCIIKRPVLAFAPSHVSRGACCHCQYPQSRNDRAQYATRAGRDRLTESILFGGPARAAGCIKGSESVPPPATRTHARASTRAGDDDRIRSRRVL